MIGLVLVGVALLSAAVVVATVFRRRPAADPAFRMLALAGCGAIIAAATTVLVAGSESTLTLPAWTPGGAWVLGIDRLSAVFLFGIGVVGASGATYGVRYLAAERAHRPVWFCHAAFGVLVAALALVVVARSIVVFLGAWELMAIGSYVLIVFDDHRASVRRAGLIFLVATHTGTLALLAMFAAWSGPATDWSFAALAAAAPSLPNGGALVLVLALIGFGVKAGIVPFHFWLPPAHAAAPTHVSALLSGVVIKTGIYGLLRVIVLLGAPPPAWWGWCVLSLGALSGVLGVLWALAQHDIKRLLAYHSVENIGIILLGVGLGSLGARYGHPAVAVAGYAGALLHSVNHALFKSLLFLGAGTAARATGTREMERMGGLARVLPRTWLAFIVGATAIVGLPPLNGFVSEWLVYRSLLRAAQTTEVLRLAALGVPALALIGALALACFAKVSGVVFLGTPRHTAPPDAGAERGLLLPMFALAALCVALGVLPRLGVAPALATALAMMPATPAGETAALIGRDAGAIGVVALLLAMLSVAILGLRRWLRHAPARRAATWGCGFPDPPARAQYTASSFASPILATFGRVSGVVETRTAAHFETHPRDLVLDDLVRPIWTRVLRAATRLRPMQQGRLHIYLLYVMLTLVVLLGYLALAP